jgi:hypothetical protein
MNRRLSAALKSLIPIAVGALFLWVFNKPLVGTIVLSIGSVLLLLGLCLPAAYAAFEAGVHRALVVFSVILAWVLLVPVYYLGFAPIRLLRGLLGDDPLRRSFRQGETSCWIDVPDRAKSVDDYRHMY